MINLKHVFINALGAALPMLVILVSVPLYLNAIGVEKYGVLSLVWIVFGYFGIFDFGVSRAVTNAISRVREDAAQKATVIWSASALNLMIGSVIALVAGVGFFIFSVYSPSPLMQQVLPALPLMMIGIPVLTITSTLNGALDGEERFKSSNAIQTVGSTLYQLAPLAIAHYVSTELPLLIGTVIVCRIIVMLIYMVATARAFGLIQRISVSVQAMRDLVKFGAGVAIINIIDPLFNRIDQVIIAQFSGVQNVTAYNIAVNSIGRLGILPMAMSRSLFPKLSQGTIEDYKGELHTLKARIMIVWFAICAAAILASDLVFELWLHNAIAPQVSHIAKIYAVGLWASCLGILPYTALQASGRSGEIIKVHLIELPFYLVALVVLTNLYGSAGAAIAYGLRSVVDYVLLWKMCHYPVVRQRLFCMLLAALAILAVLTL